ncbi:ATP-binding protein [Variovorax sp. J22R24]|uniref:AAA family ATPase n=1 Tax=Variovorax gracilis TaxID=3053502 RepID=UPI002578FAC0|nr:ATP-binding protein [Variovorax sp. J22R24]MDM0109637.1 ATP-binding protein [Variovorax sp. J22R24]
MNATVAASLQHPALLSGGCGLPAPELQRLDALIERAILRLRARYQLSLDELRGLYISDEQVDALIAAPTAQGAAGPDLDKLERRLAALHTAMQRAEPDASPWQQLLAAQHLSRAEADVLLAALAPELDPRYGPLLAYLNDDAARRWATPELAARLFGDDPVQEHALRAAASPGGRLFERGLIEWHPAARDAPARAQRGLRVAPPLADWLAGLPYADERLAAAARWWWPAATPRLPLGGALGQRLAWLAGALHDGAPWPLVSLAGADPAEALAVAHELFARAERPALQIDLQALRGSPTADEVVQAARLANTLFGVGLILAPASALLSGGAEPAAVFEAGHALAELCAQANGVVLIDTERRAGSRLLADAGRREVLELRLGDPPLAERSAAWQAALGGAGAAVDAAVLAERFTLGPARIAQTLAVARRSAALEGCPQLDTRGVLDAARAVCAAASSDVTRSVQTVFEWDDLVLPPTVHARLHDIVRAVELRGRVLEQWGFGRRLGAQRGLKTMFAGASGTGKSMAAALIAKTLALDLHRVELSGIVSKYIGETEKNLDRAFDAARSGNAILFIDEADALFGKRSEVKDAHDRYANVETAYLLQKMEDHDGVVILATNLANNIDGAFSRRMHFVVEFPLPDVPRRERLWRGMFPPAAPLGADVDFGFLARQFSFAGGDIRNIVLDASFAAAQADEPITMAQLLRAVARQYAKRGKVASVAEFREYHALLTSSADGASSEPSADTRRHGLNR